MVRLSHYFLRVLGTIHSASPVVTTHASYVPLHNLNQYSSKNPFLCQYSYCQAGCSVLCDVFRITLGDALTVRTELLDNVRILLFVYF